MTSTYPETASERDRWILDRRPSRNTLDPERPYAFLIEKERAECGDIESVVTILLTNRECPWRCLMCDLWKNTLTFTAPLGAIPGQIDYALKELPDRQAARQIKLYNSGSFFDPKAIPMADYEAIARRIAQFERVVVECHPQLVNDSCLRFRDLLQGKLEVAMGLETVHPQVLDKLNKRMTLDLFSRAAEFLRNNCIALRVFVLVKPPFLDETEALQWAIRSIDFAFDCGATVVSLIPTRLGNGALETLAEQGQFASPKLATLEKALAYGITQQRGRVFADLWDLQKFCDCPACFPPRQDRLQHMNLHQIVPPEIHCSNCPRTS